MRIGMFSECYEPVQNGVTTSVRTLVEQLRALRHHVFVVAPHFSEHIDAGPFILRVPSVQTPLNRDYPFAYPWFPKLRRAIRRAAPDIVHSHNPFFVGMLAARVARRLDLPLVSTYHTLYNHYAHYLSFLPEPAIQTALRWWIPEYYNRCAQVIVPSAVAERSLRGYGVTAPVTAVPTAVPLPDPVLLTPEARLGARERWGIGPDDPLLLYVGRIAREKNLELVLAAFDAVWQRHPAARLLVVGGGPHLEECRVAAQGLAGGARVRFAGPVPHDELTPVYAAADVFVFGSTTETQGLVMAEARAAGTPCVVARGGGASETVRDGEDGFVVPPESTAFAQRVCWLLEDNRLRARFGENCLCSARGHTPDAMARRVLTVYDAALAARAKPVAPTAPR